MRVWEEESLTPSQEPWFFPENGWLDFLKNGPVELIRKENGSSGSGVGNPDPYILWVMGCVEKARTGLFDNDYTNDIAVIR